MLVPGHAEGPCVGGFAQAFAYGIVSDVCELFGDFGIISQTLIIHMMRTNKIPFVTSFSSRELILSTFLVTAATLIITFTKLAYVFSLTQLPLNFMMWIAILLFVYAAAILIYKAIAVKKDGSIL